MKLDYKDSTGLARAWLLVKFQILNTGHSGMRLTTYYGKPEILYEVSCPGCRLFFDDEWYQEMKKAGYFVGPNGKHLGEGGAEITEQTQKELDLERIQIDENRRKLLEKGYQHFEVSDHGSPLLHGLYLIPKEDLPNVKIGTLLVSSLDQKEIIYDGNLNWSVKDGFSQYGIRPMPTYLDESLVHIL